MKIQLAIIFLTLVIGGNVSAETKTPSDHKIFSKLSVGGVGHGGGDITKITKASARFVDNFGHMKSVKYCYEVADGFPVSKNKLEMLLESTINKWTAYISTKRLNASSSAPFVTRFNLDNNCGTEDLTIYFGVTNNRVKKVIDRYHKPVGIAEKETYDYSTTWSRGFIWIAPDQSYIQNDPMGTFAIPQWGEGNNLEAILLHEFGHVFGNGHIQGTIMREDIFKFSYDYLWNMREV